MRLRIKRVNIVYGLALLRIILAFVTGMLIISQKKYAYIFFIATALMTFGEGFAFRRIIQKSLLKSMLDFVADRFLVDFVAISLVVANLLPLWVALVFLVRDLLTVVIAFILFYRDYRREIKRTVLGKISLFFQIIALIPVVMGNGDLIPVAMGNEYLGLIWIAVVITAASGIESLFKSEFRLVRKRTDLDEFKMLRLLKFADVFTLTNVIFGIISILFAVKGWYTTASLMLLLAVVSDYFDGKIAKVMGQQNDFGKELDSLADTVSFGVAPAIFGFSLIQTPLAVISFTVFLFCGILRLARYNIMDLHGSFQGMPITMNGIIVPLFFLLRNPLHLEIRYLPYLYLILGILMVSSFKIKKLH